MVSIYKKVEELKAEGIHHALCIIVSTKGSTPLKTEAKMIVTESGNIYGTIGGGNFEKRVIKDALDVIETKRSGEFEHNLLQQHGMCCGGSVTVYIESIMPTNKLYIFGAGHVGRALSTFASALDFEVFVIDERKEEMDQLQCKEVNKMNVSYLEVLPMLPFDDRSYIAIMTYDHFLDREILAFCLNKPKAYLGMIGSQRKVEITKKMFLSTSLYDLEELLKVDMPMGYNINATGPEEIAISILAKIIKVKNEINSSKNNEKHISKSNRVESL